MKCDREEVRVFNGLLHNFFYKAIKSHDVKKFTSHHAAVIISKYVQEPYSNVRRERKRQEFMYSKSSYITEFC